MFDVDTYLAALGRSAPASVSRETLRDLHKRHLMSVPYDSSLNEGRGTALWDEVDIDPDEVFDAVIRGRRGGVCHELNGLFRVLLQRLGFDAGVFAASIRQVDDAFGPELEHIFTYVRLDGDLFLADVGFAGPGYLEPLRVCDEVQHQPGGDFRVVAREGFQVVERRPRGGGWQAVYRFRPQPRDLSEWRVAGERLQDFARQYAGAGTLIRARAFENGKRILIGRRLFTVEDGSDEIRGLVDQAEYDRVLADILR